VTSSILSVMLCYVMLLTSDSDRCIYTWSKMLPGNILTRLGWPGIHRIYEIVWLKWISEILIYILTHIYSYSVHQRSYTKGHPSVLNSLNTCGTIEFEPSLRPWLPPLFAITARPSVGGCQLPICLVMGRVFVQVCFGCVRLVTYHLTKMREAKYGCHSFCLRLTHRLMREEFALCGGFKPLYRIRMMSC